MHLVLRSDATGWKESMAKLAGWPLLSTTKNSKDGGVTDCLCVATSEETVHRRTIVFQPQQLIPGRLVNNLSDRVYISCNFIGSRRPCKNPYPTPLEDNTFSLYIWRQIAISTFEMGIDVNVNGPLPTRICNVYCVLILDRSDKFVPQLQLVRYGNLRVSENSYQVRLRLTWYEFSLTRKFPYPTNSSYGTNNIL